MEEAPINEEAAAQGGSESLYAIQPIPGKGLGLITTKKIPKGTRILSELPLFKITDDTSDARILANRVGIALRDLDEAKQRAFLDLNNVFGLDIGPLLGIALSNLMPLGNAPERGIFLDAARINHSCRPNAHKSWNANIGRITVHAVRDIEQGEEITISYLDKTIEYAKRQSVLRTQFNFDCRCSLCLAPPPQRAESDAWVEKIRMAEDLPVHKWYLGGSPGLDYEGALLIVRGWLYFCKKEGLYDARISSAYHDAFLCSIKNGDAARARIFAQRAYAARVVVEGDDSAAAERFAQFVGQPTRRNQIPQGMDESELEEWLWKQGPDFREDQFDGSNDIVLVRLPM
jgi:hypothetical protein